MDAVHDSNVVTLAVGSAFALFGGGFWVVCSLGKWALAPIDRPVAAARIPTQFSVRDFLLLMVQAQVLLAAGLWWGESAPGWSAAGVLVIGTFICAAWWQGVKRLSACGVTCPRRRSVFLLLVAPAVCGTIIAALWINGQAVLATCLGQQWPLLPWLIGNLVIIGAFLTCRMLTVWAMRNVTPRGADPELNDGMQYVSP